MAGPENKAHGVISWINSAREMVGEQTWAKFVSALPPEERQLVEHPPLPPTWISAELVHAMWEHATELLWGGDLERVTEVSRRQIRGDLSSIYKLFIRIATPQYVASRAATIYQTYNRNNGEMKIVAETPHSTDVLVSGAMVPSPSFYASLRGSIFGAVEMTGVKDLQVKIVEGGGRESRCLYHVTWS
jgi:hypothetical protein